MAIKRSKYQITIDGKTGGFNSAVYKSQAAVRGFNKELDASFRAAKQLDRGLTGMAGRITGLFGGLSAGLLTKTLWDAGVASEKLDKSFTAITGSADGAKQELAFVRSEADRLGLVFIDSAEDYKRLAAAAKGTELEGSGIRDFYTAVVESGTALGATADEFSRAFAQVSQGVSRGRFELEDLKTIAEALPGVGFGDFADAIGVTTEEFFKMVSAGEIVANDFLPKLSKALHEKFGTAAVDASKSAQAALNRFETSWFDLRVAVANSGFMDLATGKINDLAAAFKDQATQQALITWAKRFFELADASLEFIKNYGPLLAKVGASLVVLGTLNRIVFTLVGTWRGLNTAWIAMTGIRLVPWLTAVTTGITSTAVAAGVLVDTLAMAAAAAAALLAGYKAGEWLTMHEVMDDLAESQKTLADYTDKTNAKFRQISVATGLAINSMADLDQAVKDGKLHYNELTGEWVKGAANMTAATAKTATAQKQITTEQLAEMRKQYQQYADQVIALQEKIKNAERSLVEQLRAMSRTGMSDLGAWQDRKKEAEEYERAAKKAADAGNFAEATKNANKAKTAYADLNKEVKDGDKVLVSSQTALKTAMAGVKRSGELAVSILKKQQQAAKEAMKALDYKSGFAGLDKGMDESKRKWIDNWMAMRTTAVKDIEVVEERIRQIKDKEVTVWINERVRKKEGGLVSAPQFNRGGRVFGPGGVDKVRAWLTRNEVVIKEPSVRAAGLKAALAFNRGDWGTVVHELSDRFATRLATGGTVTAPASATPSPSETVTLNFAFPGEAGAPSGRFSRADADTLIRIMGNQQRLRSA